MAGILRVGTSGFAYPAWSPRFYPEGLRAADLLRHYATRLETCELNNTYYQQPTPAKVDAWLAATPSSFRFAVKAQRGGSYRSLLVDPVTSVPWLTDPLRRFGDRLGTVLFRVPDGTARSDERLAALLTAWPRDLPLTMEFQDSSWHVDEVYAVLAAAGASICATDLPDDPEPPTIRRSGPFLYLRLRRHDYSPAELKAWADRLAALLAEWPRDLPLTVEFQDPSWHVDEVFAQLGEAGAAICATEMPEDSEPPPLRRSGPFLYLRLRRHDYSPDELAAWAARISPFVADGLDAFVFFRHDDVGRGAELALEFGALTRGQDLARG